MNPKIEARTNKAAPKVVICGDSCMNVILEIPETLERGSNTDIIRSVHRPGGNALVTSLALAALNVPVTYVGIIGEDTYGEQLIAWMNDIGVDHDAIIQQGNTRISYAILDESERTILDERRESINLSETHWLKSPMMAKKFYEAYVIMVDRYCSGIYAHILKAVRERRESGDKTTLVYRTGSRPSEGLKTEGSIMPFIDICLTKRTFLENLEFGGNPEKASKRLSLQFNIPFVVATLGSEGAVYYDLKTDTIEVIPGRKITSLKTTLGGGDFFRAGFLSAYLENLPIRECTNRGNIVAALHCSKPESSDPHSLFFSRREIEENG